MKREVLVCHCCGHYTPHDRVWGPQRGALSPMQKERLDMLAMSELLEGETIYEWELLVCNVCLAPTVKGYDWQVAVR